MKIKEVQSDRNKVIIEFNDNYKDRPIIISFFLGGAARPHSLYRFTTEEAQKLQEALTEVLNDGK